MGMTLGLDITLWCNFTGHVSCVSEAIGKLSLSEISHENYLVAEFSKECTEGSVKSKD